MSIVDKVKTMLGKHPDQSQQAVDKAGDMIDEKTGGKHAERVDMGQDKAKEYLDRERGQDQPPS